MRNCMLHGHGRCHELTTPAWSVKKKDQIATGLLVAKRNMCRFCFAFEYNDSFLVWSRTHIGLNEQCVMNNEQKKQQQPQTETIHENQWISIETNSRTEMLQHTENGHTFIGLPEWQTMRTFSVECCFFALTLYYYGAFFFASCFDLLILLWIHLDGAFICNLQQKQCNYMQ